MSFRCLNLKSWIKRPDNMNDRWAGIRRWSRLAFGLIGVTFLVVALVRQWDEVRSTVELSWPRIGLALVLTLLSITALAHGWATLLPGSSDSRRMRRVFYLSQPAKYIPGGIAQPVGQIALSTDEGLTSGVSITAFIVHALSGAAAGAFLAAGTALLTEAPDWLRLIAVLGLAAPIVLWRPVLVRVARSLARVSRRQLSEEVIPGQRDIVVAFGWAVGGILSSAVAFAILGGSSLGAAGWEVVAAFCLAFTAGYLAVPFPSGIGIREGALAIALPAAGLATVTAISAIHRAIAMTAELLIIGITHRRRPRPSEADQVADK